MYGIENGKQQSYTTKCFIIGHSPGITIGGNRQQSTLIYYCTASLNNRQTNQSNRFDMLDFKYTYQNASAHLRCGI